MNSTLLKKELLSFCYFLERKKFVKNEKVNWKSLIEDFLSEREKIIELEHTLNKKYFDYNGDNIFNHKIASHELSNVLLRIDGDIDQSWYYNEDQDELDPLSIHRRILNLKLRENTEEKQIIGLFPDKDILYTPFNGLTILDWIESFNEGIYRRIIYQNLSEEIKDKLNNYLKEKYYEEDYITLSKKLVNNQTSTFDLIFFEKDKETYVNKITLLSQNECKIWEYSLLYL